MRCGFQRRYFRFAGGGRAGCERVAKSCVAGGNRPTTTTRGLKASAKPVISSFCVGARFREFVYSKKHNKLQIGAEKKNGRLRCRAGAVQNHLPALLSASTGRERGYTPPSPPVFALSRLTAAQEAKEAPDDSRKCHDGFERFLDVILWRVACQPPAMMISTTRRWTTGGGNRAVPDHPPAGPIAGGAPWSDAIFLFFFFFFFFFVFFLFIFWSMYQKLGCKKKRKKKSKIPRRFPRKIYLARSLSPSTASQAFASLLSLLAFPLCFFSQTFQQLLSQHHKFISF